MSFKDLIQRHHDLARALADGVSVEKAIEGTSYTKSEAEVLSTSVTFQELVKFYQTLDSNPVEEE